MKNMTFTFEKTIIKFNNEHLHNEESVKLLYSKHMIASHVCTRVISQRPARLWLVEYQQNTFCLQQCKSTPQSFSPGLIWEIQCARID